MGKGDIACYEQFLLFPPCFQKTCTTRHVKTRACLGMGQPFTTQSRLLTTLKKKPFANIVGKGENAGNQHFLLFPQFFFTQRQKLLFYYLSSASALNSDQSRILLYGKEVNLNTLPDDKILALSKLKAFADKCQLCDKAWSRNNKFFFCKFLSRKNLLLWNYETS